MGGETESPVIELDLSRQTMLVERLKLKLAEYQERLDVGRRSYEAPEQRHNRQRPTRYRHRILAVLLEKGRVVTQELSRQVAAEEGDFDPETWNDACTIIEDYVINEGANNIGNGLPPIP